MEIFWLMVSGKLPCLFQVFTGLYCPGCGGTRAVKALLKGQIWRSFLYHPVVLYAALVGVWLLGAQVLSLLTGNERFRKRLENRYLYIGFGIIGVNFILKNMLLVVWGIDILKAAAG